MKVTLEFDGEDGPWEARLAMSAGAWRDVVCAFRDELRSEVKYEQRPAAVSKVTNALYTRLHEIMQERGVSLDD